MEVTHRAFALCALGLEKVLSNEIERLGLKTAGRAPGRVWFEADPKGLFRANLCLRTAERVLVEAASFKAADFDALFDSSKKVAWEQFFAKEDKLVIERVRIRDSQLDAQTAVQSVVHKAIYERIGEVYALDHLPETGKERSVRVYLEENECLIGLDLSGEALHKRGYRKSTVEAPLKETIAAACLFLAGWNRRIPLLDPFCGSGTILIEAALLGAEMAPGLGRSFAMETMPFADAASFEAERAAARARVRTDVELSLSGSDIDDSALAAARANAELAGVAQLIDFDHVRAEKLEPSAPMGYIVTDPPYGNRLGTEEEALDLYRRLGEMAPRYKGWGLGFVTNRQDFGTSFGRRAIAEHKILNGAEEQWFHWYAPGYEDKEARPLLVPETKDEAGDAEHAPKVRKGGPRRDKSGGDRPSKPSYGDRPPRPSYGDRPARPSYGDRPPRPSYGDRPPRPSYGDKPARPSYGDRPARPSFGDRPSRPSYGDRPARPSYGDKPRFEKERPPRREGDRPSGDRPRPSYGDRPSGDRPRPSYGDRPSGDRPRPSYGDRPSGDRPRPSYGDRPSGDRPRPSYGDRPSGDRPRPSYGDRPSGDRPRPSYGDRPSGDRPRPSYGDRPSGDRPRPSYGDRPSGDRPRPSYGDRPRTDRPPRRDGPRPPRPPRRED